MDLIFFRRVFFILTCTKISVHCCSELFTVSIWILSSLAVGIIKASHRCFHRRRRWSGNGKQRHYRITFLILLLLFVLLLLLVFPFLILLLTFLWIIFRGYVCLVPRFVCKICRTDSRVWFLLLPAGVVWILKLIEG